MKRVRRRGGNKEKEKVFGCHLIEHLNTTGQEVPQVLRSCSEFIEEHGIVDGIYRLSGVSSNTQKLRSEFDEGNPDLTKDVYLQDIHCVSSLCKAYFRELPDPLLTYQLYDRFAEAVAVQLEDERLVKIQEVLKSLPCQHFRTLEFLMRHLVKMSTFSSETNMHARNLAIVWAPNLLRSKDIEASGFNGTAAFMEVRVQSIVVEFILTHVPQLFPETTLGVPTERRKSLPSPVLLEEPFFKAMPFHCPGNMSPGDGPPSMRSYHSIIEPTDKRKGSLKGRKWKSIFNLGGRLPDPRKRNKGSTKEKEKQALRPAKSMDSLSPGPYEGNRPGASPTQLSPVSAVGQEGGASASGGGSGPGLIPNSYAVTYRRGGGASVSVVSGGKGTQGTYNRLDSASGISAGSELTGSVGSVAGLGAGATLAPVTRSPGLASRADKRAGIHISGPFSVTVPLHITSGLLGVIQGSRGEDETSSPAQAEGERQKRGKDEEEKEREEELEEMEEEVEKRGQKEDQKTEEEEKEEKQIDKRTSESESRGREEEMEGDREIQEGGLEVPPAAVDGESEERSLNGRLSSEEEEEEEAPIEEEEVQEEEAEEDYETGEGDYMEMRCALLAPPPSTEGTPAASSSVEAEIPLSVQESPDSDLPLDFQDTFGFLDMMDSSISQQHNEFSVGAPCFEEDEYDYVEDYACDVQTDFSTPQKAQPKPPSPVLSRTRPTSLPLHTCLPSKSYSLPYKSSPSYPDVSSSSEDDEDEDEDQAVLSGLSDDDGEDDSDGRGVYEDMFVRSLPNELEFHSLGRPAPRGEPKLACISSQSDDNLQAAFSLPSSGYVNMSMVDQADSLNKTDTSNSVCVDQSEEPVICGNIQVPISSQNISDCGQLQNSEAIDTSSQANQLMDIPPLSQSEYSEVQTVSSHGYVNVRESWSDGATNEKIDNETKGEEEKEEEREDQKASCQEVQRANETLVTHSATAGSDSSTEPDQDPTDAHISPQLPPRRCPRRSSIETDSNRCHGETAGSEVDEADLSDICPAAGSADSSQGEMGAGVGEEAESESKSESDPSVNAVSHEHVQAGWQEEICRRDEEEGEEVKEKEKDGENGGEIETGDGGEEESDREGGELEERIAVVDEEEAEDRDREKEECEQRVDRDEGAMKEREEEHEGKRIHVKEEEEEEDEEREDEEQPDGGQKTVSDQNEKAMETEEENETEQGEEGENEALTNTEEVGAVREEGGGREAEEGHPVPAGHQESKMESQADHKASEGAGKAEQLQGNTVAVEEEEWREKSVVETDGGRNVDEERRDRVSETDGKPTSLGQGVGRTLVVSKQAPVKTQQAKAVPVVPPKPQQSRLTALGLRQQFQSRDAHSAQQRDRDELHIQDTHNPHAKRPQQDTNTQDNKTLQTDMKISNIDADVTADAQALDTETLNALDEAQTKHTGSRAAHDEHTEAALHTPDTTQPLEPQSDPTTELRHTEPHPPHMVINQHQPHIETPEQTQQTTAEDRDSETMEGASGDEGGTCLQEGKGKDGQDELKDPPVERRKGAPHQSETVTARNRSPDVQKNRLSLQEGERDRKTRERDVKRNSGISICFDEAVARATREREREREHSEKEKEREREREHSEKEKERERGVNVQDEKARL